MSVSLLLTLGHNSSAILVKDNKIVCGYENERLSHRKSDSAFPIEAILQIHHKYGLPKDIEIYISHWFINPDIPLTEQGKWYDERFVRTLFPDARIHTLSQEFTHHDAHAYSMECFTSDGMPPDTHTIVADGFGSYGETMSIYGPGMKLIHRSFGFDSSLGLLYQYATSYLGMKENQDEYKLLGYEAYIREIGLDPSQLKILDLKISECAELYYKRIMTQSIRPKYDPMINGIGALPSLKYILRDRFDDVLKCMSCSRSELYDKRVIIAFYVQAVLELVMSFILSNFQIKNVSLVGGIFLNVKLNNEISQLLEGITSIMPLSGDQGAAIGLYACRNDGLIWPDHLYWGRRDLYNVVPVKNLHVNVEPNFIIERLAEGKIVNLVRGHMEYGARALCNTSTLALPDPDNVEYINTLNGRDTIMPMAPVMKASSAHNFFKDAHKIHKSLEYMVCARDCQDTVDPSNYGVTHKSPISGIRTCRPQIIFNDPYMETILDAFGYLINTSFNEHGTPIVYDMHDIYRCHQYQLKRDGQDKVITVILENE